MIAARLALIVALGAGSAMAQEPDRLTGFCEASAATVLPSGGVVVASDDIDELAVFAPGASTPRWSEDPGGISDTEGAARIGGTVFWITSHSLTDGGDDKKNRRKIFATTMGADGLPHEIGKKYKDLRSRLARLLADRLPHLDLGNPKSFGLNIEGLSATPGGSLLVGLRAPLTADGEALLVRIAQPFALLDLPQPGTAETGDEVYLLDLGGRGIRGIARDGQGRYVVIGGPVEDVDGFALFTWTVDGPAVQVKGADLSGMRPEAVVIHEDGVAQIFSDDGWRDCDDKTVDIDAPPDPARYFTTRVIRY